MHIIGITGPSGAGKTVAMRALERRGALALDCDDIYHELLASNAEMTEKLAARFPEASADGAIDRKKLGGLVFKNPVALADLEAITHGYVLDEVERRISQFEKSGGGMAVVCAIALIECGFAKRCDTVYCVTAPRDVRVKRLEQRDNLSNRDILARMNAQQSDDFYRENSDRVVENIFGNPKDFEEAFMNTALIDKWFDEHRNDMIAELSQLVAINSVRGESAGGAPFGAEPRKALGAAQALLGKHGLEVSVFEDMVITAAHGPEPAQLGILAHLDIVEAGEGWDTDPFELTEKDGKLYGRGAMDNKGPAIAAMYAVYCVRELFPDLKRGVQLIFGSSEETGFDDIARYMEKNAMPPDVFSPDSEFPVVNVEKGRFMPVFGAKWKKDTELPRIISVEGGQTSNVMPNHAVAVIEGIDESDAKGYCEKFAGKTGVKFSVSAGGEGVLNITAEGAAAHASRPHLGNNAQTALIELLADMPFAKSKGFGYVCALARMFPHGDHLGKALGIAMKDAISGETTVCFSVLSLDEYGFSGSFDARTAICADKANIYDMTRIALGREDIQVTYFDIKNSHHTPAESPFVQTLLRVYEEYTGEQGKCISLGGLTYVHDVDGGVAFGCNMPGEDNKVHGPNEFIDVAHLMKCAKMFTKVILEVCADGE